MKYFSILPALLFCTLLSAQNFTPDSAEMPTFIDSLFQKGLDEKLIPGGIIGVVHNNQVVHRGAYGLANVGEQQQTDFDKTIFQLGSVGKLFTALAVLREVEKGKLDLHRDVNEYLTEFKMEGDSPITLHHLLTHTAGLNDRLIGYATQNPADIESLGGHLKAHMPDSYITPGEEISYSNYSFGLAGHLVEISSGQSFTDYVQREIFETLSMSRATYHIPAWNEPGFAMGYEARDDFNPVASFAKHVTPAGSLAATGADLNKFLKALLNQDSLLLSAQSYRYLTEQQFTPHPSLLGHAYGIEMQNFNGHKGMGKGGNIPGFLAYIVLFPQYDFGMFLAVNTETDNFLEQFIAAFKSRFFPRQEDLSSPGIALHDLSAFAGDFRSNRYNRNTIEDLFGLIGGSTKVYNSGDSALAIFHNGQYHFYKPIEALVFQNMQLPERHLVFEETNGRISKMHRNISIGGYDIPMTHERVAWYNTVNFINEYAGFFPFFNLTYLLFPLAWLIVLWVRRHNHYFMKDKGFNTSTRLITVLFSLLILLNILTLMKIIRLGEGLIFGMPDNILLLQSFSYLIPIVLIVLSYRLIKVWRTKEGMFGSRIYLSLFTASAIIYTLLLHRWHFIGVHI